MTNFYIFWASVTISVAEITFFDAGQFFDHIARKSKTVPQSKM